MKVPDARRLELIALPNIGAVRPGDDLVTRIALAASSAGAALADGDVVVVAQKIVSKAEGRYVRLDGVVPSARAIGLAAACGKDPRIVEIILAESREVLRVARDVVIVEDRRGLVLANAGVDRSNVEPDEEGRERLLLLPLDPDASAARLREGLQALSGADVAVIINDSLGRAWRLGTVGVAIGVSGMASLHDRRGEPDLLGRPLEITEVGIADELAAAASSVMGQAAEGSPVVLVRGIRWPRREGAARDLQRPRDKDLFR